MNGDWGHVVLYVLAVVLLSVVGIFIGIVKLAARSARRISRMCEDAELSQRQASGEILDSIERIEAEITDCEEQDG